MKNKFMAKALLALAAVGITTTGLAASADASTNKGHGPRLEFKKPQVQTATQAKAALEAKLAKAKILVAEFDKNRTVKSHRAAQKAVNILPSHIAEIQKDKKILQDRINSNLKQELVK